MRVLFLTNFYPPHALGGYELWCHEVATALSARGHALYVVTSRHGIEPGVIAVPNVKRVLHLMTAIEYYRPIDFFARWRIAGHLGRSRAAGAGTPGSGRAVRAGAATAAHV